MLRPEGRFVVLLHHWAVPDKADPGHRLTQAALELLDIAGQADTHRVLRFPHHSPVGVLRTDELAQDGHRTHTLTIFVER